MPALGRTLAAVLIRGDDLDPATVTELLRAPPSSSARKGDPRRPGGDPTKVYRTGHWRLEADPREPGELDRQISELMARLPSELGVWAELTSRYRGEVSCALFMSETNELSELRPETLGLLAGRGLTLTLDLYGPTVDEPD